MKDTKFIYTPEIPEVFRCRVPLPGTSQAFVNNGVLREESLSPKGLSVTSAGETGFSLVASRGSVPEESMQIICFRDSGNTNDIAFTNRMIFEESSDSSVLLCTHTLTLDRFKTDETIKISVEKSAVANIVVMQNEHNDSSHSVKFEIDIQSKGYLRINVISLHGLFLENDFVVTLSGEGAVCELNGAYLVDGNQTVKSNVVMNHMVPGCLSRQLFKGILDDESRAHFSGRIVVARDAQKTEAYQANHNLLISQNAKAYTQPQLEIYADDVKCSHGATSGILDQNALFYMRSRGIGESEAKLLQQLAFVYDVLEKINNEQLRQRLCDLTESRLRGEFSHCSNCSMNCC
ncbi:MAG: SufD family Fe-S cluster assembly protein [Bacteroidales bacterium]|nr:SufD family Fe-S cluster assembly protein [Bacteroidales bacterium]